MNKKRKILSALTLLSLIVCIAADTAASAYALPGGGYLSTSTSVSVTGTVNDTVYVKYSTLQNGFTEKNEWESSYISQTPTTQSFGSQLTLGTMDSGLWWNFQRIGFPAIRMTF
jgi:hypothetical protein